VTQRTANLVAIGFKAFDAFHLASAELAGAVVFLTVDVTLLKLALRESAELRVRVADPVRFLEETTQWTN